MKPSNRSRGAVIVAFVLYAISFGGIYDDVNGWLMFVDWSLKTIDSGTGRTICFVAALFMTGAFVYPPGIRRGIVDRFRCGHVLVAVQWDSPLSSCGWRLTSGEEPKCSVVLEAGRHIATISAKHGADLEYRCATDESARYVRFVGDELGLRFPRDLLASSYGADFSVVVKLRRRMDGQVFDVELIPRPHAETTRISGLHAWHVKVCSYKNHQKNTCSTIDIVKAVRLGYPKKDYDYLGVNSIVMQVQSVTMSSITIHQAWSWTHARKVATDPSTWRAWA